MLCTLKLTRHSGHLGKQTPEEVRINGFRWPLHPLQVSSRIFCLLGSHAACIVRWSAGLCLEQTLLCTSLRINCKRQRSEAHDNQYCSIGLLDNRYLVLCIPMIETVLWQALACNREPVQCDRKQRLLEVLVTSFFLISVGFLVVSTFLATSCNPMDSYVLRDVRLSATWSAMFSPGCQSCQALPCHTLVPQSCTTPQ